MNESCSSRSQLGSRYSGGSSSALVVAMLSTTLRALMGRSRCEQDLAALVMGLELPGDEARAVIRYWRIVFVHVNPAV